MDRGTKIRLRLLIPAVENAISGSAFRPRDVYRSRKGLTVEIGNTDAEGRLILADALALADEEEPELICGSGYADRRGAGCARDRGAAFLHRRRKARRRACGMREKRERPALADAAVAPIRCAAQLESGGHQQCFIRGLCGLDHRRIVSAPVRLARESLAALRRLCMESDRQAGATGRRRVPGRAGALCSAGLALWLRSGARAVSY